MTKTPQELEDERKKEIAFKAMESLDREDLAFMENDDGVQYIHNEEIDRVVDYAIELCFQQSDARIKELKEDIDFLLTYNDMSPNIEDFKKYREIRNRKRTNL